jgi:hypothetical protein
MEPLAETIARRLARRGFTVDDPGLVFIREWTSGVTALRGTPGDCRWPTCPKCRLQRIITAGRNFETRAHG